MILLICFAFILFLSLPKFIQSKNITNNNSCDDKKCEFNVSPFSSQNFADNLEKMKNAAISYYTKENVPIELNQSSTLTLKEMFEKELLISLIDINNKACNQEESYVKITNLGNSYLLKVNLKDSTKEDYMLVHLAHYPYCKEYICEQKE